MAGLMKELFPTKQGVEILWKARGETVFGAKVVPLDNQFVQIGVTDNGAGGGGTTFEKSQARKFALAILEMCDKEEES